MTGAYVSASCAQVPMGIADLIFFSDQPAAVRAARAFCRDCPIASLCLADALRDEKGAAASGRFGIRGGTTPEERAQIDPVRRCDDCGTPLIHSLATRCTPHATQHRRARKNRWARQQRQAS